MRKLTTTFLLALGLTTQYPVSAGGVRSVTLRRECTASRCVYYRGVIRAFSVEREYNTSRLIVRDRRGNLRAKIREQDNGSLNVEETDQ